MIVFDKLGCSLKAIECVSHLSIDTHEMTWFSSFRECTYFPKSLNGNLQRNMRFDVGTKEIPQNKCCLVVTPYVSLDHTSAPNRLVNNF